MGFSVALSQNGSTLWVGAPYARGQSGKRPSLIHADIGPCSFSRASGTTITGVILRYEREGWSSSYYYYEAEGPIGDYSYGLFGYSLALSSNGSVLAVGSPLSDGGMGEAMVGSKMVDSNSYKLNTILPYVGYGSYTGLGSSIAITGDGNQGE